MSRRGGLFLAGVLACWSVGLALVGCAPTASDSGSQSTDSGSATAENSGDAGEKINLVRGDEKDLDKLVQQYAGKVVLVDFWATWCGPCVENFPHTVELYNKHHQDGLEAVTVSFDSHEDEPAVVEVLQNHKAGKLNNLLSTYGELNQAAANGFDFEGAIPHYRLYDRKGELRYQWDGHPDDLDEKVAELLAEQA